METIVEPVSIEKIKEIAEEKRKQKKEAKSKAYKKKEFIKEEIKEQPINIKPLEAPINVEQLQIPITDNEDRYKELYDDIKNIKDLINQQTNFIQEVINKPKAKKQKPKPKPVVKTLDITVTDKEIEKIIETKETNTKDFKLQQIIKALQKC